MKNLYVIFSYILKKLVTLRLICDKIFISPIVIATILRVCYLFIRKQQNSSELCARPIYQPTNYYKWANTLIANCISYLNGNAGIYTNT